MYISQILILVFSCNAFKAEESNANISFGMNLELAANFVKENQNLVRGGGDERWMYKFMNSNSILPPSSSSSGSLSDTSSDAELVVLSDSVGTAACATGWTRYSGTGMCYRESTSTLTWYAAEDWCWSQRAGAHLASVHSQAEAVWLNAQYKVWYSPMDDWIGLRRACDNVTYIWTDGSAVDFLWWQPGYPKSAYAEQSCVTIWDTVLLELVTGYVPGQFDDMKECSETGSYALCKYDPNTDLIGEPYNGPVCTTPGPSTASESTVTSTTTTTTTTTTTSTTTTTAMPLQTTSFNPSLCPSSSCPTDWLEFNSKCYALISGTATHPEASVGCENEGGSLVQIANSDENEALRLFFSSNQAPTASSISSQAWIGVSSGYTNWATGEPTATGSDYCPVFALSPVESLEYSRGVWSAQLCSSTQQFAICSRDL